MLKRDACCLKPYWGKPDVRNFRGDAGNRVWLRYCDTPRGNEEKQGTQTSTCSHCASVLPDKVGWYGVTYRLCNDNNQIELTTAGEEHEIFYNAYRFIKVATTAENDNEIEIVAQR